MTHRLNPSRNGQYFVLVGPYDAELTAKLKERVPPSHRQWRPVAKVWRIYEPYDQAVLDLLEERE